MAISAKTSLKKITTAITSITTNSAKINEDIHKCALMIVEHAQAYNDCSAALNLVKAMPKSFKRNGVIAWFGRVSPIGIDLAKDKVRLLSPDHSKYQAFDLDKARATRWYDAPEVQKETTIVTFDGFEEKVIDWFGAQINKIKKEFPDGSDERATLLAKVTAARAAFRAADKPIAKTQQEEGPFASAGIPGFLAAAVAA